jgi:hypothetical protein
MLQVRAFQSAPAEVPKLAHSSPPLSPLAQMVVDLCPGDMLTGELLECLVHLVHMHLLKPFICPHTSAHQLAHAAQHKLGGGTGPPHWRTRLAQGFLPTITAIYTAVIALTVAVRYKKPR